MLQQIYSFPIYKAIDDVYQNLDTVIDERPFVRALPELGFKRVRKADSTAWVNDKGYILKLINLYFKDGASGCVKWDVDVIDHKIFLNPSFRYNMIAITNLDDSATIAAKKEQCRIILEYFGFYTIEIKLPEPVVRLPTPNWAADISVLDSEEIIFYLKSEAKKMLEEFYKIASTAIDV